MNVRDVWRRLAAALGMAAAIAVSTASTAGADSGHRVQVRFATTGGYVTSANWSKVDTTFYNACSTSPWQGGLSYSVQFNGNASSDSNFTASAFSLSFAGYKGGGAAPYRDRANTVAIRVNVSGHILYGNKSFTGYSATVRVGKDGKSGTFAAAGLTNTYRSGSSTRQGKPVKIQGSWSCTTLERGG